MAYPVDFESDQEVLPVHTWLKMYAGAFNLLVHTISGNCGTNKVHMNNLLLPAFPVSASSFEAPNWDHKKLPCRVFLVQHKTVFCAGWCGVVEGHCVCGTKLLWPYITPISFTHISFLKVFAVSLYIAPYMIRVLFWKNGFFFVVVGCVCATCQQRQVRCFWILTCWVQKVCLHSTI